VTGPRKTTSETARLRAVRDAAHAAVIALLDVRLPPEPRRAVLALQAALEANP
jgi:hypothetical protein